MKDEVTLQALTEEDKSIIRRVIAHMTGECPKCKNYSTLIDDEPCRSCMNKIMTLEVFHCSGFECK